MNKPEPTDKGRPCADEGEPVVVRYYSDDSGAWYDSPEVAGRVTAVKVGPKLRHLRLPEGALIVRGPIRSGDLVADIHHVRWGVVDPEDIGVDSSIYDCVCRPAATGAGQE